MVQFIRRESQKLHERAFRATLSPKSDFMVEYFAALLYHTLRTIGDQTLSPLKRLLAVRSAARLIHFLRGCAVFTLRFSKPGGAAFW